MGASNSTENKRSKKRSCQLICCCDSSGNGKRLFKNLKVLRSSLENIIQCDGNDEYEKMNIRHPIHEDTFIDNDTMVNKHGSSTKWPLKSSDILFLPYFKLEKFKMDKFQIQCKVGKGALSQVFKVCMKKSKEVFALKQLRKSDLISNHLVNQIQEEVKILTMLESKSIIKLLSSWQDKTHVYQLFPYIAFGDLFTLWERIRIFTLTSIAWFALEIAYTLDYIHSKRIIYRDLKMENILLSDSGHVLLTDFGLSVLLQENQTHAFTICGTLNYIAPEVAGGNVYSYTCDWWSFGIILVTMATGKFPFKHMKTHKEMYKQIKEKLISLQLNNQNNVVKEIIMKLLCFKADERLSTLESFLELKLLQNVKLNSLDMETGPFYGYLHTNSKTGSF